MFENLDDPRKQALLALAAGLLSPVRGKGWSGFGEAASQGIQSGLLGFNQAQRTQEAVKRGEMERKLEAARLAEYERGQKFNQAAFSPGIGAQPATPVDDNGYAMPSPEPSFNYAAAAAIDPMRAWQMKREMGKAEAPIAVKKDEVLLDPRTRQPIYKNTASPDLPAGMRIGANGQPEWIPGYLEGKKNVAAAGAPRVDVKYGEGLGKALGTGTAEILSTGRSKAESAAESIQMGHTILNALDSGPVYTGPGATAKLKGQQIAQIFGFNPDPEGMQRARTIITGLANQTVNSRGLLKGQGQITEYEQKTLEKAKSGNIDDLTPDEIRTIVRVNERVSRAQIKTHAKLVTTLGKNKDYAEVLPFYQIDEPGQYSFTPPNQQGAPSLADIENEILRRRGQGGRP